MRNAVVRAARARAALIRATPDRSLAGLAAIPVRYAHQNGTRASLK